MVKCLDPNQPHIRDALNQIVTVNFAELVKMYPNVAFHHGLQRLAVGTIEGTIVVYDLRTGTKVQVMEVRRPSAGSCDLRHMKLNTIYDQ